jgi:hypothetical protein
MRYFLILFLMCGLMIFPAEKKKTKLVVKQLMPEKQKKKTLEDPTGKRDPFLNLLTSKPQKEDILKNLTIEEVKLEGIIRMKNGQFRALLVSPKGKAFIASVGEKLYDGEIAKITFEDVIFKKIPLVSLPKR